MYKSKPGIDWRAIRERFEAGEAAHSIEQDVDVDVSRVAILKRAKKEQWGKPVTLTVSPVKWLALATGFVELEGRDTFTPEKAAEALSLFEIGANHSVVRAAIGIGANTWTRWRNDCEGLRTAIEKAQANHAHKALSRIDLAAENDWKAAERQLSTNPLTKDDYAQKDGHGGISITFNINRAKPEEIEAAHMVEIEQ